MKLPRIAYNCAEEAITMRPVLLFTAVLAGCLNLIGLAEAHDRHGHGAHQARGSAHPSFGQSSFRQQSFAKPSFRQRSFVQPSFAGRPAFGPARRAQGFANAPLRFGPRQQLQRSLGLVRVPPLTVLPGTGIVTSRPVPFVFRPVHPGRSFVAVPTHRFPTFVRVFPRPAFAPRPSFEFRPAFPPHRDGFGPRHTPGG
jgi:hypothetical protein